MNKEEYGSKYNDHLLEQYKLYVQMADNISNRRAQTNRFYILLLSTLLTLLSIIIGANLFINSRALAFLLFSILGILLCCVWFINIRSYRQLNSGKFKIIHKMEQHLPFPCYDKEWELLGKGRKSKKYFQLSRIEQYVPLILVTPYVLLFIYALYIIVKR